MCLMANSTLSAVGTLHTHRHHCREWMHWCCRVLGFSSNLFVWIFRVATVCNDRPHGSSFISPLCVSMCVRALAGLTHASSNMLLCSHLCVSMSYFALSFLLCSHWESFTVCNYQPSSLIAAGMLRQWSVMLSAGPFRQGFEQRRDMTLCSLFPKY